MVESITLYADSYGGSPYTHRVLIALEEAGAKYATHGIDLSNKPLWYAEKVNPVGKVPAIAYGGPACPVDDPSPGSVKLRESLVLVEFIAELYPECGLLPKDLAQRAKARLFIENTRGLETPISAFVFRSESGDEVVQSLENMQSLLGNTPYAIGDQFTIADVAVAPLLARFGIMLKNGFGGFGSEKGKEIGAIINSDKFAKLWKYYDSIKQKESFKKTFDEEKLTKLFEARLGQGPKA